MIWYSHLRSTSFHSRRTVQLIIMSIRRADTDSLCMRLLTGGEILPGEAADIMPVRADFTPIWRRLQSLGGRVFGRFADVRRSLDPQMHPGTLCTCLVVFSELNLIDMSFDGETFEIVQKVDFEKTDLFSSKLLKKAHVVELSRFVGKRFFNKDKKEVTYVEEKNNVELMYKKLEEKIIASNPLADLNRIRAAFEMANEAHAGQKRREGSPYVTHVIKAAENRR